MSIGFRHRAAVIGSLLLLSSLGFGAWTQLTLGVPAELNAVHFPVGTQVGYAVGGVNESLGGYSVVAKTTDGGTTWTTRSAGGLSMLNSVYFKDNNNGYVVGDMGTAIRITDGRDTAMGVPDSGTLNNIQFPENGPIGYIGLYPQSGGAKVLKTTDGGDSWTSIVVGGPSAVSRSCGMATDSSGVVVGDSGLVMATTDGFGTYAAQDPQTTADIVAAAFSKENPNRGYLIGNDLTHGVIRYTDDGGATPWDSVRCWNVSAFYGVDVPTDDDAYVCGTDGMILRSVSPHDFYRTTVPTGLTATMHGLCFPKGRDTGYAVGAGGTILKTTDGGIPMIPGVAEGRVPTVGRAGIRVVSNPSRHGIAFRSDADVDVVVLDAAGRVVMSRAATKGLNFLPMSKAGVYFLKADAQTIRVVLTQ